MKYDEPEAMQWVKPIMRGYKIACCDCGLVHCMDFTVVRSGRRNKVLFRVQRLNRSTAMMRRHSKIKIVKPAHI